MQKNKPIIIKIQVSREDPLLDSIVSVMLSAPLYEAELRDHFGIEPKGHPTLTRLFVTDDPSSMGCSLWKRVPRAKSNEADGT